MNIRQNWFAWPPLQSDVSPSSAIRILAIVCCGLVAAALLRSFVPTDHMAFRSIPAEWSQRTTMHMDASEEGPGESAASRPVTETRIVSCEELAHVPGKSITTTTVAFPPNAYTPKHRHPGSVTVYVLKGRIRSQLGGGPVGEFGVGDSFFEPPGAIHLFAENASATEPAEILAIFVADQDCGPLIIYDDQ